MRVIETEDELAQLCQGIVRDSSSEAVVLLQSFDHKLRSYQPIQCWILLTVLTFREGAMSYLIDSVGFKDSLGATLGAVCKTADILKVVES